MEDDTRGILDPSAMARAVDFARYPAGPEPHGALTGVIEWFWSVRWDLPAGSAHDQQVLNHPAGHISVGTVDDGGVPLDPAVGRFYPLLTGVSSRHLIGDGWTIAARTTVGGAGVLLNRPVKGLVDQSLPLPDAVPGLAEAIVRDVSAAAERRDGRPEEAVALLQTALADVVQRRPDALVSEARFVSELAGRVERDRSITRIEGLASTAGVSVRTLQRLFDTHVGVSPSFVIRRWRIIEAAEAARSAEQSGDGSWAGWAAVAAELGYSDQAHLSRDFKAHLGVTPSAYLERNSH